MASPRDIIKQKAAERTYTGPTSFSGDAMGALDQARKARAGAVAPAAVAPAAVAPAAVAPAAVAPAAVAPAAVAPAAVAPAAVAPATNPESGSATEILGGLAAGTAAGLGVGKAVTSAPAMLSGPSNVLGNILGTNNPAFYQAQMAGNLSPGVTASQFAAQNAPAGVYGSLRGGAGALGGAGLATTAIGTLAPIATHAIASSKPVQDYVAYRNEALASRPMDDSKPSSEQGSWLDSMFKGQDVSDEPVWVPIGGEPEAPSARTPLAPQVAHGPGTTPTASPRETLSPTAPAAPAAPATPTKPNIRLGQNLAGALIGAAQESAWARAQDKTAAENLKAQEIANDRAKANAAFAKQVKDASKFKLNLGDPLTGGMGKVTVGENEYPVTPEQGAQIKLAIDSGYQQIVRNAQAKGLPAPAFTDVEDELNRRVVSAWITAGSAAPAQ